jgi:hypothetical protein
MGITGAFMTAIRKAPEDNKSRLLLPNTKFSITAACFQNNS